MRTRHGIVCLIVTALFALAPTALAAKGGKPDKPGSPPEHPDGLTCQEQVGAGAFAGTDAFTLDLPADTPSIICIDWTTTTTETEWLVTIAGAGIRGASFNVRDSHPGDFCSRGTFDRKALSEGAASVVVEHSSGPLAPTGAWRPIPIAVLDACGFDYTDSADSLVLTISYRGTGPFTVEVSPAP